MGELEVEALREELEQTRQALKKAERQLEKSQSYNEELRQQIERLSTELHSYRSASQNRQEVACQVGEKDFVEAFGDKPFPVWGQAGGSGSDWHSDLQDNETPASGASIAESLKAAAEEVVWEQAGFVYDNQSGLYYDYNSGYYYDSARSLYYDPRTGSYFYYNETAREYKFHSYASGQQPQETYPCAQGDATHSGTQGSGAVTQDTKSAGQGKRSKRKDREKPKVQKRKKSKLRRRTKEPKHKDKTKSLKKEESQNGEDCDIVMVEDADERDGDSGGVKASRSQVRAIKEISKRQMVEGAEENMKVEVIDVESSDSLATGESEIESEPESGELESSSSSESDCEMDTGLPAEVGQKQEEETCAEHEASVNWPPCVRVVVQTSDVIEEGSFFMVTCTGGTIGREKDPRHVIQVPDINVSKIHAEFQFDYSNNCYTVQDLGSQNGTFINDLRISETKVASSAVPVCHGDTLQVASTRMLLHIHPGTDTCDHCEPGQVLAAIRAQQTVFNEHIVLTKEERKQQARKDLKQIKKKYGLANAAYVDNTAALKNPAYADKADLRRKFVGSEHPSHNQRDETPASVHRPISAENKGHRMLAKMGWKEGSGLGKDNAGRAEPVSVEMRANQTAGLGSSSSVSLSLDNVHSAHKAQRWAQAQQRYHNLGKGGASPKPSTTTSGHEGGDSQTLNTNTDSSISETNSASSGGGAASGAKIQFRWIKGGTEKPP
ncbi:hypothetical protein BaRGS_00030325 [Batillaria attramentaria]|uniref:Angiogenic factor with G patch and FHA domains 1 n=1 Tax=Batillaria attramentaria TaxID=370345 RepID=A0ABD0JTI5_9CAEN